MAEYPLASQTMSLGRYASDVNAVVQAWDAAGNVGRLWRRDAALFSGADEARWMAWLDIVDIQLNDTSHLLRAAEDAAGGNGGAPFQNVVVLGMGGSSLCPEVMARTFGEKAGHPRLLVLDSTVPAQVQALDKKLETKSTLFVVASKSGGTIEPNSFKQYFFESGHGVVGAWRRRTALHHRDRSGHEDAEDCRSG